MSGFGPTITIEDREIDRMLKAGVTEYKEGARQAFNLAAGRIRKYSVARITQEAGVAKKHVRIRTRLRAARKGRTPGATVSFYVLPLVPHKIGGRQTASGVKAGKHMFQGGFFAPVGSDKATQVAFRRQGSSRLPIERIHIPMEPKSSDIVERASERYGNALVNKYLPEAIGKVLDKAAR